MSDRQTVAPTTYPVTLAEVKAHLNVSTTFDDSLITRLTAAATVYLENKCNRAWITQTRELKMRTFDDTRYVHDRVVYFPRSPLASTADPSIAYTDSNGNSTTASTTSFVTMRDDPGRLAEAYNNTWPATRNAPDDVTITYVTGYGTTQSSVPEPVRQAIGMLVAHWYRNREAVGTVMSRETQLGVDALLANEVVPHYG